MRWVRRQGEDVLRINDNERNPCELKLEINDDDFKFTYKGIAVSLNEVSAVWYRKGRYWFDSPAPEPEIIGNPALTRHLASRIRLEHERTREYFHELLLTKTRVLGRYDSAKLNKLTVCSYARRLGIQTAETFISNRSDIFLRQLAKGQKLVTKAISDGVWLWDFDVKREVYVSYTEELTESDIANCDTLPLSLAQVKISKEYEVRSFFIDGKFFSTAIFSQQDANTAIDFRKYNLTNPNRQAPHLLPAQLCRQLEALFKELKLNTGSVDLVVDKEGKYIFLEINPAGQYAGPAEACNYNIDLAIATWLTNS